MSSCVYLFPDTNLFIQCRPLTDLDWSKWSDFDHVVLVVCRPVQKEIDGHKNKGNSRLARRARQVAGTLRQLLVSEEGYNVIREQNPHIRLIIDLEDSPNAEFAERLDYGQTDDALVGTISSFSKRNSGADVRLLSHDGGPLGLAKMLRISYSLIPDDWLLDPEPSPEDKRIRDLEQEISLLRAQEPAVQIRCLDKAGDEIEAFEATIVSYPPFASDELLKLTHALQQKYPMGHMEFSHIPSRAFKNRVDRYIKDEYPAWLQSCLNQISRVPHLLTPAPPSIRFMATNNGSRPAQDVLVSIKASGPLRVMRTSRAKTSPSELTLPAPPVPPRYGSDDIVNPVMPSLAELEVLKSLSSPTGRSVGEVDSNSFYWTEAIASKPRLSIEARCKQWRHGTIEENFPVYVVTTDEVGAATGTLECCIQAANLSKSVSRKVIVAITHEKRSAFPEALSLINGAER